MKIVFHVGMGKTGTTSIQGGLDVNADSLVKLKVRYLGPWFDVFDETYSGRANQRGFFSLPADEQIVFAKRYFEYLREISKKDGVEIFIVSNESLWGQSNTLKPFFKTLASLMTVEFIAYARNPDDWLRSAYSQWGISHKTYQGRVRSFESRSRPLIKSYREVLEWVRLYGKDFMLCDYDTAGDVFEHFIKSVGIKSGLTARRLHSRSSDAQLVLRLLLNDRHKEIVEPELFNKVVQSRGNRVLPLEKILENYFDYSEGPTIVKEQAEIFRKIKDATEIDLTLNTKSESVSKDINVLRNEILDHILEVTITLAERVYELEKAVNGSK